MLLFLQTSFDPLSLPQNKTFPDAARIGYKPAAFRPDADFTLHRTAGRMRQLPVFG